MRLICCCLLVVGLIPAPAGAQPASLAEAAAAYEKQRYKQAEEILRGILAASPQSFPANELLGLVLTAQEEHAAASRYFKAAVLADPSSVLARANLAANLAQLNQNVLAEREFKNALRLDPTSYELNHNLGEFYARLGRFGEAVALLKEAQRIQPLSYSNGYDLALAQVKAGMLPDAELQIKALLKMRETAELHGLLGAAYEGQGKFVEAAAELQRAAQMDPSEGNLFDWGTELVRHQTLEPAVQVFRLGASRYPRSWRMQAGLGVSRLLHEDQEGAAEAFCAAIDLAPTDPRAYSYLAKITAVPPARAGQIQVRFERYAEAEPRNPRALYYYAVSLWNSAGEQPDSAGLAKVESLLRSALALDPAFAEAHLQSGLLYSRQENHTAAVSAYEQAIASNPSLRLAHYRLGQTLIHVGQEQRGQKELQIWNELRSREKEESEKARAQLFQFVYAPAPEARSRQ